MDYLFLHFATDKTLRHVSSYQAHMMSLPVPRKGEKVQWTNKKGKLLTFEIIEVTYVIHLSKINIRIAPL